MPINSNFKAFSVFLLLALSVIALAKPIDDVSKDLSTRHILTHTCTSLQEFNMNSPDIPVEFLGRDVRASFDFLSRNGKRKRSDETKRREKSAFDFLGEHVNYLPLDV